jgi:phage-related minor tail protein
MEAWGSDKDLFSRGEAELVTDPALTAEPLASPGIVFKRLRGTAEEHMAALPEDEPAQRRPEVHKSELKKKQARRPSRAALEAAERALAEAEERQAEELRALAEREAELARERRDLTKAQAEEKERLGSKRDKAAAAYEEAIRRWKG